MSSIHVSSTPHVRSKDTTQKIMLIVVIALLPSAIFGIVNFGVSALVLTVLCVASAVASEWVFNKITKRPQTIGDLSAVVTGL
ncbi:MAG: RnfABCDGE type electron transport complex subunit D, partial [Lachnospiraceae bacterium]|nr:RnfABCDGE type electron transport complex subunit D [Lachnospiraceae bacterium]